MASKWSFSYRKAWNLRSSTLCSEVGMDAVSSAPILPSKNLISCESHSTDYIAKMRALPLSCWMADKFSKVSV